MAKSDDPGAGSSDGGGSHPPGPDDRIRPSVRHHAPKEARVLGGSDQSAEAATAWDREPLTTLRAERRLLRIVLPAVLVVGLGLGLALLRFGLQIALIGMLIFQTGGFFAAYVVAQRRRMDPLRKRESGNGKTP